MIGLCSSQVTLWSFTESLLFLQVKKGEERGGGSGFYNCWRYRKTYLADWMLTFEDINIQGNVH